MCVKEIYRQLPPQSVAGHNATSATRVTLVLVRWCLGDVALTSIAFMRTFGGHVRYRTAAVVSVLMIAVMFGLPAVVKVSLLPRLSNPVPFYDQVILNVALFCLRWQLLLVPPIIGLLFTIATFTRESRVQN